MLCNFCGSESCFELNGEFVCLNCNGQTNLEKENVKIFDQRLLDINKFAANWFASNSCEYFENRGLTKETQNRFGLGFSPKNKSVVWALKKAGFKEEEIIKAGLAREYNGKIYDFFYGRAMFPIRDENDYIVGFGGRVLDDTKPKYLNTKDTDIFKKSDILYGFNECTEYNTVYLVEGYMDVVSLHQAGINNSVAALGTAVHKRHCALLKANGITKVILCLDSDEAGISSALRTLPTLIEWFGHQNVRVLSVPDGKDPDEFLKNHSAEEFRKLPTQSGASFVCKNADDNISAIADFLLRVEE